MQQNDFITPSANIETLDEGAEGYPIIRELQNTPTELIMSNSFGFGGTNASLVFRKYQG